MSPGTEIDTMLMQRPGLTTKIAGEADFLREVADPFGLHELEQPAPTHASARGRSRLDRIYWNSHLSNQLDRKISCSVLEWVAHLSANRVLSWRRCMRPCSECSPAHVKLQSHVFRHPEWRRRVAIAWDDHLRAEPADAPRVGPVRRLVLLKRAIREVSLRMQLESETQSTVEPDDYLGITM